MSSWFIELGVGGIQVCDLGALDGLLLFDRLLKSPTYLWDKAMIGSVRIE